MTQTQPSSRRRAVHGSLVLTEIFASIQGEGTRAGRPCTSVRLTGCDLRCRWCDTAYAFTGGERVSIDAVMDAVQKLGLRLVCVTGGEPLLQPRVHDLMRRLCDGGYEVLLETGGHRDIGGVDARVVRIVDLKPPGSGEEARNRWENLELLTPSDEVKVVLAGREDYEWARAVVRERDLGSGATVLFSPVHGALDPRALAEWILADHLPVRMQVQLHKIVWGPDARGV